MSNYNPLGSAEERCWYIVESLKEAGIPHNNALGIAAVCYRKVGNTAFPFELWMVDGNKSGQFAGMGIRGLITSSAIGVCKKYGLGQSAIDIINRADSYAKQCPYGICNGKAHAWINNQMGGTKVPIPPNVQVKDLIADAKVAGLMGTEYDPRTASAMFRKKNNSGLDPSKFGQYWDHHGEDILRLMKTAPNPTGGGGAMSNHEWPDFNLQPFEIMTDDRGRYTHEPILLGIANHLRIEGNGGSGFGEGSFDFSNFSGDEGNPADVCKTCYQAFKNAGATDAAAKGILANIACESGFKPRVITWDGNGSQFGFGGGLCGFYRFGALPALAKSCGWTMAQVEELDNKIRHSGLPYPTTACHHANAEHIKRLFGGFPFSLEQQLRHIVSLKEFQAVKGYSDPRAAAKYWIDNYEKPAKKPDRWALKGSLVLQYLGS